MIQYNIHEVLLSMAAHCTVCQTSTGLQLNTQVCNGWIRAASTSMEFDAEPKEAIVEAPKRSFDDNQKIYVSRQWAAWHAPNCQHVEQSIHGWEWKIVPLPGVNTKHFSSINPIRGCVYKGPFKNSTIPSLIHVSSAPIAVALQWSSEARTCAHHHFDRVWSRFGAD